MDDEMNDWKQRLTPTEQVEFICKVLSIKDNFGEYSDMWKAVWWRVDDEYAPLTFLFNCNDLFYWGCADCEEITPENFHMVKDALTDAAEAIGACDPWELPKTKPFDIELRRSVFELWQVCGGWAVELFCARVRGMRPQRPCYENWPPEIVALFDACGPQRDPKNEG